MFTKERPATAPQASNVADLAAACATIARIAATVLDLLPGVRAVAERVALLRRDCDAADAEVDATFAERDEVLKPTLVDKLALERANYVVDDAKRRRAQVYAPVARVGVELAEARSRARVGLDMDIRDAESVIAEELLVVLERANHLNDQLRACGAARTAIGLVGDHVAYSGLSADRITAWRAFLKQEKRPIHRAA